MTLKLGLVGLGHIARHHVVAIAETPELTLTCTCDLRPRGPEFAGLQMPHFREISEMLARETMDVLVIATPPATHADLAQRALHAGIDVLLEKPATMTRADYRALRAAADASGRRLDLALHAAFGREMAWFAAHKDALYAQHGAPVYIACQLYDPYTADGVVTGEAAGLGGCWRDAGINALSVLDCLVPLEGVKVWDACLSDQAGAPGEHIAGVVHLAAPDWNATIDTNWICGENLKKTHIRFAERDASLVLHHSGEYAELRAAGRVERVTLANGRPRLTNHYLALFAAYAQKRRHGTGFGPAMALHDLLFEALEKNEQRDRDGR